MCQGQKEATPSNWEASKTEKEEESSGCYLRTLSKPFYRRRQYCLQRHAFASLLAPKQPQTFRCASHNISLLPASATDALKLRENFQGTLAEAIAFKKGTDVKVEANNLQRRERQRKHGRATLSA